MSGTASRIAPLIAGVLHRHSLFALVLLAVVATRLPFLADVPALKLLNQDFNAEHFGRLYLENDLPAADLSEVGDNARTLSLASAYFWLPLLCFKLGVPFDFFAALQALVVLPLACLALYRLALALCGSERIACLAVLVFLFKDFALYRLNLGYPLLLNRALYYSDANVVFILFSLGAMARGRVLAASAWSCALALCNPVTAVTLWGVFGFFVLFSDRLRQPARETVLALAFVPVAALAAFLAVTAATPIHNPAPEAARAIAILGNAHLAPHIAMPAAFLLVQVLFIAGLAYAALVERKRATLSEGGALVRAVIAAYLVFGWLAYWALFLFAPALLVMVVPSKIFALLALYLVPFAAYGLHSALERQPLPVVLGMAFVAVQLSPANLRSASGLIAIAILGVLACAAFFWLGRADDPAKRTSAVPLYAMLAVLAGDFAMSSTRVFRSGELAAARAFHDIQAQIRASVPRDAMFTAWRHAGSDRNPIGPFGNWAFRTYSRRGAEPFWNYGRNIYFNSARLHRWEVESFAAFGVDVWDATLREAATARQNNPLLYYTGLRFDGLRPALGPSAIASIIYRPYDELKEKVSRMDLAEFKRRAGALGVTHILVSRDPGKGVELAGVAQNEYFVVIPVDGGR